MMKNKSSMLMFYLCIFVISSYSQNTTKVKYGEHVFILPTDYLLERENIPNFWINTNNELDSFLRNNVKKGEVEIIGISAGGRPIKAVSYGLPRKWGGTTTFSGALGFRKLSAYRGPDHDKIVYMCISGVHGGEFEGIVGTINLISIIETGFDLRGKKWPELTNVLNELDRIVLIPIVNPDGRERVPIKMQIYRDRDRYVHEYLNTGGHPDGTITGWPQIKEFIPMDFSKPGYPGGYPNDAGVNIMHDDFFGNVQPETKALFYITEREKPDLVLNMHTGGDNLIMLRPFTEIPLQSVFDSLFIRSQNRLATEGLLRSKDLSKVYLPVKTGTFNLSSALNLHCGALCVTVESPSHGYDRHSSRDSTKHTPDLLLDGQLIYHLESMKFLSEKGGRSNW